MNPEKVETTLVEDDQKLTKQKRREQKKERNQGVFGFAIVALVLLILGVILTLAIQNKGSIADYFSEHIGAVGSKLWNAIVFELFTFVLYCMIMFFVCFFYIVVFFVSMLIGPFLLLLSVIASIIQISLNKKWYSVTLMIITPIVFVVMLIVGGSMLAG